MSENDEAVAQRHHEVAGTPPPSVCQEAPEDALGLVVSRVGGDLEGDAHVQKGRGRPDLAALGSACRDPLSPGLWFCADGVEEPMRGREPPGT